MAAASDWITTTRQALPHFFRLVTKIKPDFHLADIRAINPDFIARHDVRALLWDVDGTLMPHHDMSVAPEFQETLRDIEKRTGIGQAILSNCGEARFTELGTIFPELPVLKAYTGPGGRVLLRSLYQGRESWKDRFTGEEVSAIESIRPQLQPIKKPSAPLIEFALERLGLPPREHVFMVGDQYFTDIAGANLAGVRSIKVSTFRPESFPFAVRSFQRLERIIYRLLY